MKLRPARAVRSILSQSWARYSVKKPRKNYVKSLPHTSLTLFNMGPNKQNYDLMLTLKSDQHIQLRSNSLEAARLVANKYLEREIVNNYRLSLLPYPHNVIREKKRATGAGADRLSQGMSLSFGSPSSVAARVKQGQTIFILRTVSSAKDVARDALRRAASKLSGTYTIKMSAIPKGSAT
ncbi:MAG: 50S ribosomal protein L16 [Candidatus Micrarchaeota archaeon]|nr:50S ribosomal protein L16 [Candidatus Micrarchaeota archaeon]MDE1859987.1 50S ribosomal protein L16 [Candidatus Micrarchaeota archaeon]